MQLRHFGMAVLPAVLLSIPAFAADDTYFQIKYALTAAGAPDTIVNVTNTGASLNAQFAGTIAAGYAGTGFNGPFSVYGSGYICVNAYVVDAAEEEIACCSCKLSPNALGSWSVLGDLISNPGTPTPINGGLNGNGGVSVKLIATLVSAAGTCDPTTAGLPFIPAQGATSVSSTSLYNTVLAPGMLAWARTPTTDTPFSSATLSMSNQAPILGLTPPGELGRLTSLCAFNTVNGTGAGLCKTCQIGAR